MIPRGDETAYHVGAALAWLVARMETFCSPPGDDDTLGTDDDIAITPKGLTEDQEAAAAEFYGWEV